MPHEPRTVPCPGPGCSGTATLADEEDFDGDGAAIWICSRGHQGPRLIGRG